MARLRVGLALVALLAMGGASWWRGALVPYEVTVRPVVVRAPAVPPQDSRWLIATVTQSFPGLEGLALGDRVQFDRYGLLEPQRGSVHCAVLPWWASAAIVVTPIGGRLSHEGVVSLVVESAPAPGCAAERAGAVIPVYAGRSQR